MTLAAPRGRHPRHRSRAPRRPGYLDLDLFGIDATSRSVTSRTSTSTCPAYQFGDKTYTRLGRRLQRLHLRRWQRQRQRHHVRAADVARSDPAQRRARALLDRPQRLGRSGHPGRHADRRRQQLDRRAVERPHLQRLDRHRGPQHAGVDRHERRPGHLLRLRRRHHRARTPPTTAGSRSAPRTSPAPAGPRSPRRPPATTWSPPRRALPAGPPPSP